MPKILYLARHAKSDWNTGQSDFDRPLNSRGERDAPEMGSRLKSRGVLPDRIVCSTATRARQTLELMDLTAGEVVMEPKIYEASTGDLLELAQNLDDAVESALFMGHNPSMTWLASLLADTRIEGLPTCAIATVELDTERWAAAGACEGRLLDLDYPKKCG